VYKAKKLIVKIKHYIKSKSFHRLIIAVISIIMAYFIVLNASADRKFDIKAGEKSKYDIKSPRDIENKLLTERVAQEAANEVEPVIIKLNDVPIDIINSLNEFLTELEKFRIQYEEKLKEVEDLEKDEFKKKQIESSKEIFNNYNARITNDQIIYIFDIMTDSEFNSFEKSFNGVMSEVLKEEIRVDNKGSIILKYEDIIQKNNSSQELKNIEIILLKAFIKENSEIDEEKTKEKRQETYNIVLENKKIIYKDDWIINKGDPVTDDIVAVVKELNLYEDGKFDFIYATGLLIIILFLVLILYFYMKHAYKEILESRKELLLITIVSVIILLTGWAVSSINILLIPIFLATMIFAIMLNTRIAILMNFILSILLLFIAKGDMRFLYMSFISGTLAAFFVTNIKQRSRLALSGILVGFVNAVIIFAEGIMRGAGIKLLLENAGLSALNGLISVILTIGLLPFLESVFNLITPIKLVELSNPNQPIIKKLLLEAPGTYHHSLMVGNLAETATEAINGNALLARVGAYYHDIGKLKRPNFFGENQMSENPHEKMTPNLSTLVITAHTNDGKEMADKYKLPELIKEIIVAHHGTTLVSFFYHKAQKDDAWEEHKKEDFRYDGPKPSTKEAAVVMLADSVEAAVRSMIHKTEGKIEGLVRKLIKDKLEDGQLDNCDLTLKDLNNIAISFMQVFSGYFHKREEYPDLQEKKPVINKQKPLKMISDIKKSGDETISLTVVIENLQTDIPVSDSINKIIKKAVEICLKHENIKTGIEVNVMLVDDKEIRKLNKEHRKQDSVTDVLSFPIVDMFEGKMQPGMLDFDMESEQMLLGDIVISVETAKRQAEEYGHTFEREIGFLTAHSVLHLLGYDHKIEEDDRMMREKQRAVLLEMGLNIEKGQDKDE
jgi:rRNA maturation RNase YbeY